ncbi:transposase, partial [Gracilimonas sp.]|uniref:transposase n=1 Tax=Gracilimonas sp. TaxID=1974203 RepID=UPI0028715C52|nr:transposase [Gracilimonas sp.]
MNYITGEDRHQSTLLPPTLDEYVHPDNPVRFIDVYIEGLDMCKLGFTHARLSGTGRPPYRPQDLLKLYVYGYLHKIRSSRGLERETHRNIELMWLLGRLQPDFKTIADFRKNNSEALKGVCGEFILLCKRMNLFGGELVAIDGSKFEAVNHSSGSFTRKGLQQALEATARQLQQWLDQLDQADHDDPS